MIASVADGNSALISAIVMGHPEPLTSLEEV
jgi:hypothetical protein